MVDGYGSALVGIQTIDLRFPDTERMRHRGLRFVDLEIGRGSIPWARDPWRGQRISFHLAKRK